MRKLLWLLAVVCCTASVAMAGPNANGVIVIHDTGLVYSSDNPVPPVTEPPATCGAIDNQIDVGMMMTWKAYAVFPSSNLPRLKGVSWGEGITPTVFVLAAGLPDPVNDFEVTQDGWPAADGGSVGMSFPTGAKLTTLAELYWFGGYAYGGPGSFCAQAHSVSAPIFVDDSVPALTDLIAGYGCVGFGQPGSTPCPPELGACCQPDGACALLFEVDCLAPGVWHGEWVTCEQNPCPLPGKCCYPDGTCALGYASDCIGGIFTVGGICEPNTCDQPLGACCMPYACEIRYLADCAGMGWTWIMFGVCDPNPCPIEPTGACCQHDGSCAITVVGGCPAPGIWHPEWLVCDPNPCPQPDGACCAPYACSITKLAACQGPGWTWFMDGVCDPNPCPLPPSEAACCIWGWVNGQLNWCVVTVEADCLPPNEWKNTSPTCDPNPCTFVPTENKTWGEIKNIYR